MRTIVAKSMCVASLGVLLISPLLGANPVLASGRQEPVTDSKLKDRIEYRLETADGVKKYDLSVKVDAGAVMLKGTVATAAQKAEAGTLANIKGVTMVDNQIAIDKDADKTLTDRAKAGMRRSGVAATDAWITTKVKWFHTLDELLDGSHIDVDTNKRVVTLNGTVKSAAGKQRAVVLANTTDGVLSVVDNLTVVSGSR